MSKKVLIIDDSEFMQLMLKDLFTNEGFEIAGIADNGRTGFETYKKLKPDLVTLDMIMPGENGVNTLKDIMEFDKNAKILVISSKAQREKYSVNVLELGAKALLLKPFRPSDFRNTVQSIFKEDIC